MTFRKTHFIFPLVGAVLVGLLIFFRSGYLDPPPQASDFALDTLQGERVVLSDFIGHPVVLTFFLSRCPDCNEEAPLLNEMYEKYGESKGLVLMGIGIGEELEDFVERNQVIYPVLYDRNARVARRYQVERVPHMVFIDRQGRVIREKTILSTREELEQYLQQIL